MHQPFRRFAQVGRVALCNYGEDYGKLVVIIQVIDQNRVLVSATGMKNSVTTFKRISLTDIVLPIEAAPDAVRASTRGNNSNNNSNSNYDDNRNSTNNNDDVVV